MSLFFSKLGFIHRRLWNRGGFYRGAVLFGPAPLIGCGLAAGIWFMVQALPAPAVQPPDWGKPPQAAGNWSTTGEPQTIEPAHPIPPVDANGRLGGYEAGWRATIHPIEVGPNLDTETKPEVLNTFLVDGSKIDLAQIIAAGPKGTKFVGIGSGFLVIRVPGIYAIALRFERPSGPSADCLTSLAFGPRKVVSNYDLASSGNVSKTYDAVRFDLQPGLYPIGWIFGCWQNQETVGPGHITVLVSCPGDQTLQPARPDDIVRPEQINTIPKGAESGKKQLLGSVSSTLPDCTTDGYPTVTVTKAPESGQVTSEKGEAFPSFPKDNIRFACDTKKVASVLLYYASNQGFTGDDTASIDIRFPDGSIKKYNFVISVR